MKQNLSPKDSSTQTNVSHIETIKRIPETHQTSTEELPFIAPCNTLHYLAPLQWLEQGWKDFRRAPVPSLTYGTMLVLCSYLVAWVALTLGNFFSLLALASGFIFLGPILAMAFYEISLQLQAKQKPNIETTLSESLKHIGDQLVFTLILLVIFLVWARAASMIHIFFPANTSASATDLAVFLGIGTIVGSIFATLVFCISAFSLPMLVDRKTDTITAVITSFNAVLRNKSAMCIWAMLITLSVAAGLLTGFLGLAITLPIIGHATWHAYQETIDATAWPKHDNHHQ